MTIFIPVGRFASEPTTRESGTGRTCCSFNFAVDTGVKNAAGEKITNFFNVTVWGKTGETVQKNFHKGDAVSITGTFCARPYESKKDGSMRTSLDINATSVDFLPGGKKDDAAKNAQPEEKPAKRRRPAQQVEYEEESDEEELPF